MPIGTSWAEETPKSKKKKKSVVLSVVQFHLFEGVSQSVTYFEINSVAIL